MQQDEEATKVFLVLKNTITELRSYKATIIMIGVFAKKLLVKMAILFVSLNWFYELYFNRSPIYFF